MLIGVDIESIIRFNKTLEKDKHFLERIYTTKELEYCFSSKNPAKHLAVRFCAKEAVYKAINGYIQKSIDFKNIEILNDDNGRPYVILHEIKEKFDIDVSLSHDKDKAIAFVLAVPVIN